MVLLLPLLNIITTSRKNPVFKGSQTNNDCFKFETLNLGLCNLLY